MALHLFILCCTILSAVNAINVNKINYYDLLHNKPISIGPYGLNVALGDLQPFLMNIPSKNQKLVRFAPPLPAKERPGAYFSPIFIAELPILHVGPTSTVRATIQLTNLMIRGLDVISDAEELVRLHDGQLDVLLKFPEIIVDIDVEVRIKALMVPMKVSSHVSVKLVDLVVMGQLAVKSFETRDFGRKLKIVGVSLNINFADLMVKLTDFSIKDYIRLKALQLVLPKAMKTLFDMLPILFYNGVVTAVSKVNTKLRQLRLEDIMKKLMGLIPLRFY